MATRPYVPSIESLATMVLFRAQRVSVAAADMAAGETFLEFSKWAESDAAPSELRCLDRRWLYLLFWCGTTEYDRRRIDQMYYEGAAEVLPYIMLDAYACPLPAHQQMDKLIAMHGAPIWAQIWPPNGWLCRCTTISLLEDDPEAQAVIAKGANQNLSAELFESCHNWPNKAPIEALRIAYKLAG